MSGGKSSSQPASQSPTAAAPAGPGQTVTQQSPPPAYQNWYGQLAGQAMNLASQPWPGAYPGQTVAQFTPQQTQAFQEIGNIQGQFAPFLNAAGQAYGQATQPLWPSLPQFNVSGLPQAGISAIGNAPQYGAAATQASTSAPQNLAAFYSPFTQQVAGNLQNLYNQQNAQQLAQVAGSEVGQGAFGGDRQAVAEALTAQQQQLAQAPVMAQTLQQGFQAAQQQAAQQAALEAQTGLGAGQLNLAAGQGLMQDFNQQQQAQLAAEQANAWLASQAGFGLAGLGAQQQQLGLAGAGALGQAGLLQQQLAQEQLNVPYEQWQQMQFWPYQQLQFAAPIVEGVGSLSGGTAATATPAPSMASQLLGLGALGLGVARGAGAFSGLGNLFGSSPSANTVANQFYTNPSSFLVGQKRGGRVGGYQSGGSTGPGSGGGGLGSSDVSFTTEPATALGTLPSMPDVDVGLPQLSGGQNIRGPGPPDPSRGGGAGTSSTASSSPLGTATGILGDLGAAAKIGTTIAGFFGRGGEVDDYQMGGAAQPQEPQPVGGLPAIPKVPVMWMDMLGKGAGPREFQGHLPEPPKPPPQQGLMSGVSDVSKALSTGQSLEKSFAGLSGGTSTSQDSTSQAHEGGAYQAGGGIDPQAGFGMTSDLLRAGGGQHPVLNSLAMPRGGLTGGSFGSGTNLNAQNFGGAAIPQHFRMQGGGSGMEAEAEASPTGATSSMMNPMMQGAYQQMGGKSLEELRELQGRFPPSTQYGQIIQRVIRMKEMSAPQQAAGQETPAQMTAQMGQSGANLPFLSSNFLPMASSTAGQTAPQPLGGGSLGGTAQTQQGQMQRGGETDGPRNYVTEDELDPHPVVDSSGASIMVHYPSEGSSLDLGLPTSFKRHAMAKYGGRIRMQAGGATPPQYGGVGGGMMGMPAWMFSAGTQGYPGVSGPGFNAMGRAPGFQFEPSQMGWYGAGAGYRSSPNPFAGISPVQMPNVGQATIPQPMSYQNLAGPQISGSTYGLGQTAQVQNPPPVPFSSLGATPPAQNFGGPSGVSPAAQGGRIRLQGGGGFGELNPPPLLDDPTAAQDTPLNLDTLQILRNQGGLDPAAVARVGAAPSRRVPIHPRLQWLGQQMGAPFGQDRQPITVGPSGVTPPTDTTSAPVAGSPMARQGLPTITPAPLPAPRGPVTTGAEGTTIAGRPVPYPPGGDPSLTTRSEASTRFPAPTSLLSQQKRPTPVAGGRGLGQHPQAQAQPSTADELNRQELAWLQAGHTTPLPTSSADRLNAQQVEQRQGPPQGLGQRQPLTADELNRQQASWLQSGRPGAWPGALPQGSAWLPGLPTERTGYASISPSTPTRLSSITYPDPNRPGSIPPWIRQTFPSGWDRMPGTGPMETTGFMQPVTTDTAPVTPVDRTALAPLPTAARGGRIRLQGGGTDTPIPADAVSGLTGADVAHLTALPEQQGPPEPYGPPAPSEQQGPPEPVGPPIPPGFGKRIPPGPSEASSRPHVKDPAAQPMPDEVPKAAPQVAPPPVTPAVATQPGLGAPHPQVPAGGGLGAHYSDAIQHIIDRLEQQQQGHEFYGSPWMALTAAGLGMMGGTSPWPLVNIGRGGLEGLQMYAQQQQAQPGLELQRVKAAEAEAEMAMWPYRQEILQRHGGAGGESGISGAPGMPVPGIIPPTPGTVPMTAGTISADAIAPGSRLEKEYGRYAPAVVAEWQKMGISPAVIQAGLISADNEGKLNQPWVPGDGGQSFGSWQFNKHGQLPPYQAWAREHGIQDPEQNVVAQGRFVMETMERLHPGFSKIQDPNEAVRLITSLFERPRNLEADTAKRLGDIPRVQAALAAGATPEETAAATRAAPAAGERPVQLAQATPTTATDASPDMIPGGTPPGGPTAHPQQPGVPAGVPTAQAAPMVTVGPAGLAMPTPLPGYEVQDRNFYVEQTAIGRMQDDINLQKEMAYTQLNPTAALAALAPREATLSARIQAYNQAVNNDQRIAAPREAAITSAKEMAALGPHALVAWLQQAARIQKISKDEVAVSGFEMSPFMQSVVRQVLGNAGLGVTFPSSDGARVPTPEAPAGPTAAPIPAAPTAPAVRPAGAPQPAAAPTQTVRAPFTIPQVDYQPDPALTGPRTHLVQLPGGGATAAENFPGQEEYQKGVGRDLSEAEAQIPSLAIARSTLRTQHDNLVLAAQDHNFYAPGPTSAARQRVGAWVNDLANQLHRPDLMIDPVHQAVADTINKNSFALSTQLLEQISKRPAQIEWQSSMRSVPSNEQAPFSALLLSNMMLLQNEFQAGQAEFIRDNYRRSGMPPSYAASAWEAQNGGKIAAAALASTYLDYYTKARPNTPQGRYIKQLLSIPANTSPEDRADAIKHFDENFARVSNPQAPNEGLTPQAAAALGIRSWGELFIARAAVR